MNTSSQKKYRNLQELLKELYLQNQQTGESLSKLFGKRLQRVSEEDMLAMLLHDGDRLMRLHWLGFLEGSSQRGYSLDERLVEFFEKFLEIEEHINPAFIKGIMDRLQENMSYYDLEQQPRRREEYLQQIGRSLRSIGRTAIRHTAALQQQIKTVYETETNLKIKEKKLQDIRHKRNDIAQLLEQTSDLLHTDAFFSGVGGEFLQDTIQQLREDLRSALKYLTEIQQAIIEYLNRSRALSEVYEKLQLLKHLNDRYELLERSSLKKELEKCNDLPILSPTARRMPLDLALLEEEGGLLSIQRIAEKVKASKKALVSMPLQASDFEQQEELSEETALEELLAQFLQQPKDLYSFLGEKEEDIGIRFRLFCKLASRYETSLQFTGQEGVQDGWHYAMIIPSSSFIRN